MSNANRSMVAAFYWGNAQKAAPGIALGVFLLALFYFMYIVLPLYQERDTAGAVTRQGVGVVTSITNPGETRGSSPVRSSLLRVQMNGMSVYFHDTLPVSLGETLRVYYRVGKSGTISVSRAEPAHY